MDRNKNETDAKFAASKVRRGFAAMSSDVHRKLSAQGGRNVGASKRAFAKNHELAVAAGRKGGSQGCSGAPSAASSPAPYPLAGKLVLVAEDDYLLAEDIAGILTSLGAEIAGPFPSVAAALGCLDENAPALDGAVVDINLRDQKAFPLADCLSQKRVPYVFITAFSRTAIPLQYAWVPLFEKPVTTRELASRLGF